VILVGHSYGGMVIGGAAEKIPDRIKRLVYLDAYIPQDGKSVFDLIPGLKEIYEKRSMKEEGKEWLVTSYEPCLVSPPCNENVTIRSRNLRILICEMFFVWFTPVRDEYEVNLHQIIWCRLPKASSPFISNCQVPCYVSLPKPNLGHGISGFIYFIFVDAYHIV
jgi:hypothetical protein